MAGPLEQNGSEVRCVGGEVELDVMEYLATVPPAVGSRNLEIRRQA